MAAALPRRLPSVGRDPKLYRAAHGLSLPLRARRHEVNLGARIVARSGAAVAIASLAAGGLAYVLSLGSVEKEDGKECPRCNGTGREVCWCRGWSDGDATGCRSCNYSGFTSCKACGGGGTAVPIRVKIRADD